MSWCGFHSLKSGLLIGAVFVWERIQSQLRVPLPQSPQRKYTHYSYGHHRTENKDQHDYDYYYYQARFPFKRNRLRCVRCINENRNKRKLASNCVSCGFRLCNAHHHHHHHQQQQQQQWRVTFSVMKESQWRVRHDNVLFIACINDDTVVCWPWRSCYVPHSTLHRTQYKHQNNMHSNLRRRAAMYHTPLYTEHNTSIKTICIQTYADELQCTTLHSLHRIQCIQTVPTATAVNRNAR